MDYLPAIVGNPFFLRIDKEVFKKVETFTLIFCLLRCIGSVQINCAGYKFNYKTTKLFLTMDKQQLIEAYKKHWLENGTKPVSVYSFCKNIECSESEFYTFYNSLESLDQAIWLDLFNATLAKFENDEIYNNYSAQEKLLAFYFLWVQKLKENRSYILLQKDSLNLMDLKNTSLNAFKTEFYHYAENLVKLGYETNEIKERKFISDKYTHGFWLQALFVLKYWIDDKSENFEMTDAAIEKAVALSFKLISDNTLDSLIDFGKFVLIKK